MTLRMETTEQFVHRANIARYQKNLATYLSAEERRFVERRLAEICIRVKSSDHLIGRHSNASWTVSPKKLN